MQFEIQNVLRFISHDAGRCNRTPDASCQVGPERATRLLEHFGSVEAVLTADAEALDAVPGIGKRTAQAMRWAVEEPRAVYAMGTAASSSPL